MDDLAELALGNITYAGFWARFAAVMLDTLILLVVAMVLGFALAFAVRPLNLGEGAVDALFNVVGFALSLLYYAALESGPHCATYGKRALHLQVLSAADLTRIGFLRAVGRWFARWLSMPLMIGYLMQPFNARKRALHDYVVGTVVVEQAPYSRALVGVMIALMVLFLALLTIAFVTMPGYQDLLIRRRG